MNKRGLFYEIFLLLTVGITLSSILIWTYFNEDQIQLKEISKHVSNVLEAQSALLSHNLLVRRMLIQSGYDTMFKLALTGGVAEDESLGRYYELNIVDWHHPLSNELIKKSFLRVINSSLLARLNRSKEFLPPLKEEAPDYHVEYMFGNKPGLFVGVRFPQEHFVPVPVSFHMLFSSDDKKVKVTSNAEESSSKRIPLPDVFCDFIGDCKTYMIGEEDADKLKMLYWAYLRYGLLLDFELVSDSDNPEDYLCLSAVYNSLTEGNLAKVVRSLNIEQCNSEIKKNYCCFKLFTSSGGKLTESFYTDSKFFNGFVRRPLEAYKYFDYPFLNRSEEFLGVIAKLKKCISGKISETDSREPDSFYSKNYLSECLDETTINSFKEKDFYVFDYSIIFKQKPEKLLLYNLSDTFSMMAETSDVECVGPDEISPLFHGFENPSNIVVNRTHFVMEGGEMSVAVQKLNGFSSLGSPQISSEVCVTDFLGEPILAFNIVDDKLTIQEILTIFPNNYINWYKDENGKVCIAPVKFSDASKIKLAKLYLQTFYEKKLEETTKKLFPGLGTLIKVADLIEKLKKGKTIVEDAEDFCNFLENKGFTNVYDIFKECENEKLIGISFSNFNQKLDQLKKQKCSVVRRWYAVGAMDKSFEYPMGLSDGSLSIRHPIFRGSFFVG